MDVILYRRFSSDEQEKGDSLTRQSRVCEKFAADRGWTITTIITDKGRSAFKGDHLKPDAELGAFLLGDIEPGTILLAERLDRLSRRPVAEAMAWLFSLTSRGLGVAIADKGKVFTANLTFEEFMSLAFSFGTGNEESAKKSERTISARHALWKDAETKTGKWTNLASRPPLWLIRHPDHWEIIEHRAEIVRQVFQWSADGLGVVKITARLNTMPNNPPWGVWHRSDGKSWCRTSVRQLIANPAVEGDLVPEAGMFFGRILHRYFPRIVDADVVASARANQRQRSAAAGGAGRFAATGNANLFSTVCGECGHKAHLSSSVSKGKRYPATP